MTTQTQTPKFAAYAFNFEDSMLLGGVFQLAFAYVNDNPEKIAPGAAEGIGRIYEAIVKVQEATFADELEQALDQLLSVDPAAVILAMMAGDAKAAA